MGEAVRSPCGAWWIAEQAALPLAGVSTHFALELELDEKALGN
jgi:hypothetical protein